MPIKYVDLFCGMGSFHHEFKKKGWKCVMACDISPSARKIYFKNYHIRPLGDICNIKPKNIPKYDILCAGFPCQPFSQVGKQKGFKDKRGTMIYQIMKFVKYHKPKAIVLENVPALLTHNQGKTFKKIKLIIGNAGYNITYKILKCSDYGIPQMRKRLFVIGIKNTIDVNINKLLKLNKYKKKITLRQYLGKKFNKTFAYTIRCGGRRSPINDRHNWDGYIVNKKIYRLTIEDALKLQGFETNFKLIGNLQEKWNLLGNTIPTIFTKLIAKRLQKFIFSS